MPGQPDSHTEPLAAVAQPRPVEVWAGLRDRLHEGREAAQAAQRFAGTQALLARVHADRDVFYRGHEGGFPADDIETVARALDGLEGARFGGITTFPALLFDPGMRQVRATANLRTLERTAGALARAGWRDLAVNAPGTTSAAVLPLLAAAGATEVEPGHGLTGTTPLHAVEDLPEAPAVLYLSEVSHLHAGKAYCFGGGLYVDPVFPPYEVQALVGSDPDAALSRARVAAELPAPEAIDYYGILDLPEQSTAATGDSVVFGFRPQAFVTRACVVAVAGIASGHPQVKGVHLANGHRTAWPNGD